MIAYHLTTMDKLENILLKGLSPNIQTTKEYLSQKGILLYPTKPDAWQSKQMTMTSTNKKSDNITILLTINLPDEDSLEYTTLYKNNIPVQAITHIDEM